MEDVIKKYLNRSLHDAGSFRLPANVCNPLRQQYDAKRILAYIDDRKRMDVDLRIGLVDVDIYPLSIVKPQLQHDTSGVCKVPQAFG